MAGNKELIEALNQIEKEKDISKEVLFEAIENSLLAACKNEFSKNDNKYDKYDQLNNNTNNTKVNNIKININRENGAIDVFAEKQIVENVEDDLNEITLDEAKKLFPKKKLEVGDFVNVVITPKNFMRISAQKAKQAVVQKIREEERKVIYNQFINREHDVVTGIVQHFSGRNITMNLGKTDAILPENEQIPNERLRLNDRIKVYVLEVKDTTRGPRITVSRSNKELVKRLFEEEVTEVSDGIVEIKSIAREAGFRTKMAVYSSNPDIDPVGACVGLNGERVNAIVDELHGEKIDIINWNDDPAVLIENALSPAKVISVEAYPEDKWARVIVPDYQLSLAIGREGQNARLAARLTGYKIDIKPESQSEEEDDYYYYEET